MAEASPEVRQYYEMVSVRRAGRPPGTEGSNWHRYVIAFAGRDSIQGCRKGSLNVVTGAVEDMVAQLNERHRGKQGRVHLVLAPKVTPNGRKEAN